MIAAMITFVQADCPVRWHYRLETPGSIMTKSKTTPADVDAYIASVPPKMAAALVALRALIRAEAPGAEETIRMGTPTYIQYGNLVSFSATAKHCAFYVMSPGPVKAHAAELAGFDTAPTAIRFQPDKPIPDALVAKIVRERIDENTRKKK